METRYVYDYQEGRMRSEEIKVVEKGRLNKEAVLAELKRNMVQVCVLSIFIMYRKSRIEETLFCSLI